MIISLYFALLFKYGKVPSRYFGFSSILYFKSFFHPMIFAGHPATIAPLGILLLTNEFAAIITSSSIITGPEITTLGPIQTLSPMFATFL